MTKEKQIAYIKNGHCGGVVRCRDCLLNNTEEGLKFICNYTNRPERLQVMIENFISKYGAEELFKIIV